MTYKFKEINFNNEIFDNLMDVILTNYTNSYFFFNKLAKSDKYKKIKNDIKFKLSWDVFDEKILYNICKFIVPKKRHLFKKNIIEIENFYFCEFRVNMEKFINQELIKSNSLPDDV